MKGYPADKKVLLSVADGPEGIELYVSEDQGVVDWSSQIPALYLTATLQGALVTLGPFQLLRPHIERALGKRDWPEAGDPPENPKL